MSRNFVIYKARNSGIRVAYHERSKPTIPRFTNFENLQNRNEIKLNYSCCASNKCFMAESIIMISVFYWYILQLCNCPQVKGINVMSSVLRRR